MSKWTRDELEKSDDFVRIQLPLVLFVQKKNPLNVKKCCPYCGDPFDKFLVMAGAFVGCTKCAPREAAKRGLMVKKENILNALEDMHETVTKEVKDIPEDEILAMNETEETIV